MDTTIYSTACSLIGTFLSISLGIYIFKRDAIARLMEANPNDKEIIARALVYFNKKYTRCIMPVFIFVMVFDFVPLLFPQLLCDSLFSKLSVFGFVNASAIASMTGFMLATLDLDYEKILIRNLAKGEEDK